MKTNRIALFEKVSRERFLADYASAGLPEGQASPELVYDEIQLPKRATSGSAGYDFFSTADLVIKPGQSVKVPTGIRVKINEGWFLGVFPRSSLGFKYRLQLANTVGIIDSDYYYADNEGHIFIKITNDCKEDKDVEIKRGFAFCQGIFLQYGLCIDDSSSTIRKGGLGSSDAANKA